MTVDLSLLPDGGVGWLDASGQHSDIVLSTRIRLARNVEGYAFTGRARDGERLRVLAQVREAVASVPSLREAVMYRLDELPPTSRALLHERHLVSKELAGLDDAASAAQRRRGVSGGRPGRDGQRGGSSSPPVASLGLRACKRPSRPSTSWIAT